MVGLIQKILFAMIKDIKGEEGVKKLKQLARIPLDKSFQMNLVYSDEEWQRLYAAAHELLQLNEEEVVTAYADYFGKDAIQRFPTWFQMSNNSYEFLSIQPVIHNCFATSNADASTRQAINDKFRVEKSPKKLITHYRSPNKLCSLYKALANWVINYYHDEAQIEEKKCLKLGDDECEIHVQWTKLRNWHAL
ncbi:guanylate cyclase [Legionella lansingensis]|uniref:Guanylate cyclase n=1 Tax=Legionella lansingensis TaxID=45067 RepID=A0A0W0V779_9GAMM|nr:heme NO-binding domain-containing protein [Legionella lansingensis]KTD15987.1 guanylate cyclase [Legionella lansingensis]SNV56444.1 guanylate cyclase [Legionella lansingensis]